jgi:probable rRNA maturation factor
MLDLVFHDATARRAVSQRFVKAVVRVACSQLKLLESTIQLGVFVVGEKRMERLNRDARGIKKPTNVLSFPLLERADIKKAMHNSEPLPLGDIYVCFSIAQREAREKNMDVHDYVAWLLVHGILHLVGYHHEGSVALQRIMERRERQILDAFQQVSF